MPYSVETKDGIIVDNIPDDVPADDPSVKQRIMAARAERDGGGGELPAQPPQEQPSLSAKDAVIGLGDIVAAGVTGGVEDMLAGYSGLASDTDLQTRSDVIGRVKGEIPDWKVGEQGQQLSQAMMKAYQDYVPADVQKLITTIGTVPEEIFQRGMDTSSRLREKGYDRMAGLTESGAAIAATGAGAVPTALEAIGALKVPSVAGRTAATAQRVSSPAKREIANQLKRQAIEGEYIPNGEASTGTDLVVQGDPWTQGRPQLEDDLGLSGSTTSTAPYKLNKYGKLIDNPKHKIAQEAGFSDAILSFTERVNPDTRAKLNKMINSRERLFEVPESSTINDPSIVSGESLGQRLKIVKDTNRKAGQAIDKYVNQTLGKIELNTIPLMDEVSDKWGQKGIKLDTNTWDIDYGDMELNKKGQAVINDLLNDMKKIQTTPTGRTVHNLKRALDDEIAYGKKTTGLDAKTQGLLKDFRLSTKEFLENQFPEYGRANAEYSKTVDVINRIQKGAGKVDLDGEFTEANLGRMSRAIMSQRISRDEIATAIKDLDSIAVGNGYKLKDDLGQQVYFANQLDDIWGPSRATGFANQTKQGAASAAADIAGGGVQGGVAIGKKAMELLRKKQLDDKAKFKAMRELLKKSN